MKKGRDSLAVPPLLARLSLARLKMYSLDTLTQWLRLSLLNFSRAAHG
ncbi:hypothetical protein BTTAP_100014 [Brochothrix thermosphacta]|uniref:Uncharacterized protein n=1 Tax=Brochothrix thermosphacta TaxID=2756 RepID=A0A2X0QDP9_BROTH|nr:hypothetical protein BTH160X_210002 [Brochothrix thermosphacta]SPP26776.1 hypothetical protein BTTAP_100014 [Brochothrix thermosphacta]SPP28794.1 hypothetical protein BTBSAS_30112 [Brochothrix thermosphacta]